MLIYALHTQLQRTRYVISQKITLNLVFHMERKNGDRVSNRLGISGRRELSSERRSDLIAVLARTSLHRTYRGRLQCGSRQQQRGAPHIINTTPQIEIYNGFYILKTNNISYNHIKTMNKTKIRDISTFRQRYLASGMDENALELDI